MKAYKFVQVVVAITTFSVPLGHTIHSPQENPSKSAELLFGKLTDIKYSKANVNFLYKLVASKYKTELMVKF